MQSISRRRFSKLGKELGRVMVESVLKLISELPKEANVTITRYQCDSKQEAEKFVESITQEKPLHDSLYGEAWCLVTLKNVEVIAFYDQEGGIENGDESL
jgi:hypothetical protein